MIRPSEIFFFPRPPRLPVLVMDPRPILAADSLRGLASVLRQIADLNPTSRTICLAGGDGTAFTYDLDSGHFLRSFGSRNIWTKNEIVQAYNASCVDERDRYMYSLANRRLQQVVADVALLILRR